VSLVSLFNFERRVSLVFLCDFECGVRNVRLCDFDLPTRFAGLFHIRRYNTKHVKQERKASLPQSSYTSAVRIMQAE
jgi:hypothetical protein